MAQQDTPAAGSGQANHQQRVENIHAICAIQTDRALEQIEVMHVAALKKSRFKDNLKTDALWAARYSLEQELSGHLLDAQRDGKLLTCWRGNSVESFARNPGRPA